MATVVLTWLLVLAGGVAMGAASWYLVERPFQLVFGARRSRMDAGVAAGRTTEMGAAVQA